MFVASEILVVLKKLRLLGKAYFVVLYGSQSNGKSTPLSDIDICISSSLSPPPQRLKARVKILSLLPEKYDVHFFEDLPIYVKKRVLSGKVIYVKDRQALMEEALGIISEYEDFEQVYLHYIGERAYG